MASSEIKPWAREWLEGVLSCVCAASVERRRIQELQAQAESLGSQAPSTGGHNGAPPSSSIESDVVNMVQAQDDYASSVESFRAEVARAATVLDGMAQAGIHERKWSGALSLRYINGLSDNAAARIMCVSTRTFDRYISCGIEWLDTVGKARAVAGVGIATT